MPRDLCWRIVSDGSNKDVFHYLMENVLRTHGDVHLIRPALRKIGQGTLLEVPNTYLSVIEMLRQSSSPGR